MKLRRLPGIPNHHLPFDLKLGSLYVQHWINFYSAQKKRRTLVFREMGERDQTLKLPCNFGTFVPERLDP